MLRYVVQKTQSHMARILKLTQDQKIQVRESVKTNREENLLAGVLTIEPWDKANIKPGQGQAASTRTVQAWEVRPIGVRKSSGFNANNPSNRSCIRMKEPVR